MRRTLLFFLLPLVFLFVLKEAAFAVPTQAIMSVTPVSQTLAVSEDIDVSIVLNGRGQTFNAAQGTVVLSSNLALEKVQPGNCNFTFITSVEPGNPSFIGTSLGDTHSACVVYKMTLKARQPGTGTIELTNTAMINPKTNANILSKTYGATYTIIENAGEQKATTPANTHTIYITVVDFQNKPVTGAKVAVTSYGEKPTDKNGVATFTGVTNGTATVSVQNNSQKPVQRSLAVQGQTSGMTYTIQLTQAVSPPPLWSPQGIVGVISSIFLSVKKTLIQ